MRGEDTSNGFPESQRQRWRPPVVTHCAPLPLPKARDTASAGAGGAGWTARSVPKCKCTGAPCHLPERLEPRVLGSPHSRSYVPTATLPSPHELTAGTHQDIDSLLTCSPNGHPAISAAAATAAWAWALDPWLLGVAGPAGGLASRRVPAAGARAQT